MQDSTLVTNKSFQAKAINNFASILNNLADLSITIFIANKKVISFFKKDKLSLCNDKGKFRTFLIVRRWQI